jgi:hypothetical protein
MRNCGGDGNREPKLLQNVDFASILNDAKFPHLHISLLEILMRIAWATQTPPDLPGQNNR